ncbi:hypothetical protein L0F63_002266 [Massospora cicadina]|nr:hypothetical protein L0F63_002266 [Massospora cicadina]
MRYTRADAPSNHFKLQRQSCAIRPPALEERNAILEFTREYNHEFPILSPENIHDLLNYPDTPHSHQLKDFLCTIYNIRQEFKVPMRRALAYACTTYINLSTKLIPDGPYFMARFIIVHAIGHLYNEYNKLPTSTLS